MGEVVLELHDLVRDFAAAMLLVDAMKPQKQGRRGQPYGVGVGPHEERETIGMVLAKMTEVFPVRYASNGVELPYGDGRFCDLWFGEPLTHAVEVKMARLWQANGKADDTAIKDLLSPYADDRSALSDCTKLASSGFQCTTSVIIYGFEKPGANKPLEAVIAAFETLARERVALGRRVQAPLPVLVHPVHASGGVYGWTVASQV